MTDEISLPLSSPAVDWLELLVVSPQHEDDVPEDVVVFALKALRLVEPAGGGWWRITDEGVSALTFNIVRA